MSAPPKQHGPFRLEWQESPGISEWHAGGLTRHFKIYRTDVGSFVLKVWTGDNEPIRVGVFGSLLVAKFRAQRILDQARP